MTRTLVAWGLYPSMLLTGLMVTHWGLSAGYPITPIAMAVVLSSALPLVIAQRYLPVEESWNAHPRSYKVDLLHMASTAASTEVARTVAMGVVLQLAVAVHGWLGTTIWPTGWPLPVQFALGVLAGDFLAYWVHRTCHKFPLLWRVHAMHHSSEHMYVFAAARNHPMNAVLMNAAHLVPLTLLGAPVEIIGLTTVFTGIHGMLQHCNVALEHGWFNYVFATADLHRWHHSADLEESNRNFGNNLIVWDALFGTRYLPGGHPQELGLGDVSMRENFLSHLMSPFRPNGVLSPRVR